MALLYPHSNLTTSPWAFPSTPSDPLGPPLGQRKAPRPRSQWGDPAVTSRRRHGCCGNLEGNPSGDVWCLIFLHMSWDFWWFLKILIYKVLVGYRGESTKKTWARKQCERDILIQWDSDVIYKHFSHAKIQIQSAFFVGELWKRIWSFCLCSFPSDNCTGSNNEHSNTSHLIYIYI